MDRKNEIITELYKKKTITKICKNMGVNGGDIEDLVQEIYLILLEYDTEKIEQMYINGQLNFFIVKIINNQYFSANSPFYKKYKKYYNLIDGNIVNSETENENGVTENNE